MIETNTLGGVGDRLCIDDLPTFSQTGLQVLDVMSKVQFVVTPDSPIQVVTDLMTTRHAPLVAVEEAGGLVAVITEREIARGAARHGAALRSMQVKTIMAPLPAGIDPECPLLEAAQLMRARRLRWLPVTAGRDVISIVTQADLTRAATLLPELGDVGSIMSVEVITIDAVRSLLDATQLMADHDISCLVAMHQGKMAGVLTEADILRQIAAGESPWSDIAVADVMTFPVVAIEPDCSLSEARAIMDRTHVHRLVVVEGGQPCGLITQTDITRALERRRHEQEDQRWRRLAHSHDAIFAVDLAGSAMYVNPAFLRLFGLVRPEALIGKPFLPRCCWSNPADRAPFMTAFESRDLQVQTCELKTASGRRIRTAVFSTIVKNFRGEVIGRQGILWPAPTPQAP